MKPPIRITYKNTVFEELDRKTATAIYLTGGEVWYRMTDHPIEFWLLRTGLAVRAKYLAGNFKYFRIIYET